MTGPTATGPVTSLRVHEAGWGTTIQDRGRTGWAHLGVPTAGAVDAGAHDLVNRLVGNEASAATIETLGGLVIEAVGPAIVARSADGSRHTLAAGDRLLVEAPADGVWGYLAVRGGVAVEPVLGSRSSDTLSGLGPPPIAAGDLVPVGPDPRSELVAELAPRQPRTRQVRLWPGPQSEWFVDAVAAMTRQRWTVTDDVSRVGARLSAGTFEAVEDVGRMRSIGLVPGAIQVTPSGGPIVMLANHPTTGGYPVIAVVDPDDLAVVAQSGPGSTLRFVAAERTTTSARRTT